MTRTTFLRRTTLHLGQIRLTDERTFMTELSFFASQGTVCPTPVRDSRTALPPTASIGSPPQPLDPLPTLKGGRGRPRPLSPNVAMFHRRAPLLQTVHNAAARQVVGRQLHQHPVPGQDADEVLAHLARDVGEDLVLVLELDAEHGVRQRLDHGRLDLDGLFFLRQTRLLISSSLDRQARTEHPGPL